MPLLAQRASEKVRTGAGFQSNKRYRQYGMPNGRITKLGGKG